MGKCWDFMYRTILPWMAHETQYWSLRYILGTAYSGKTEASDISPVGQLEVSIALVLQDALVL